MSHANQVLDDEYAAETEAELRAEADRLESTPGADTAKKRRGLRDMADSMLPNAAQTLIARRRRPVEFDEAAARNTADLARMEANNAAKSEAGFQHRLAAYIHTLQGTYMSATKRMRAVASYHRRNKRYAEARAIEARIK